jgi:hypothetical protein
VKKNFWIDVTIFILFLIGFEPGLTGNAMHEWLNLVLALAALLHLLLHGNWVTLMTRRLYRPMSGRLRLNYWINVLLALSFVMIILSGLMISRTLLAGHGDVLPRHSVWHELHSGFSNFFLFLVAGHFALHWRWTVHAWTCIVSVPLRSRFRSQRAAGELA